MKVSQKIKNLVFIVFFSFGTAQAAYSDCGCLAGFAAVFYGASVSTAFDATFLPRSHYGYHRHCCHWKQEAKSIVNDVKAYKQTGLISEALQEKIDKMEGQEQTADLTLKQKIKLIKKVSKVLLRKLKQVKQDEQTN